MSYTVKQVGAVFVIAAEAQDILACTDQKMAVAIAAEADAIADNNEPTWGVTGPPREDLS